MIFTYPHVLRAPACNDPCEFPGYVWHQKGSGPGLSSGVVWVIIHLAILVQYRLMTDGRTDWWSQGHSAFSARKKSPGINEKLTFIFHFTFSVKSKNNGIQLHTELSTFDFCDRAGDGCSQSVRSRSTWRYAWTGSNQVRSVQFSSMSTMWSCERALRSS